MKKNIYNPPNNNQKKRSKIYPSILYNIKLHNEKDQENQPNHQNLPNLQYPNSNSSQKRHSQQSPQQNRQSLKKYYLDTLSSLDKIKKNSTKNKSQNNIYQQQQKNKPQPQTQSQFLQIDQQQQQQQKFCSKTLTSNNTPQQQQNKNLTSSFKGKKFLGQLKTYNTQNNNNTNNNISNKNFINNNNSNNSNNTIHKNNIQFAINNHNSKSKTPQPTIHSNLYQYNYNNNNNSTLSNRTQQQQQQQQSGLNKIFKDNNFFQSQLNNKYINQYFIDKGNNPEIIKYVLKKRNWWSECFQNTNQYQFRWKPTSAGLKFDNFNNNNNTTGSSTYLSGSTMSSNGSTSTNNKNRQIINHIENHQQLSNKSLLYQNLRSYCKLNDIKLDHFIPKTYVLNIDSDSLEKEIKHFLDLFFQIENNTSMKNIWLMKPNDLNRGRGIHLFNSLSYLYHLLREYSKGEVLLKRLRHLPHGEYYIQELESDDTYIEKDPNLLQQAQQQQSQQQKRKQYDRQIVIQKYLESPLLYNNRKFDIRVWVLIDQDMRFYFFKEGYIRLASEYFDLSSSKLKNLFIHLTNNAIQKHSSNYSRYEEGNIGSFRELEDFLKRSNKKFSLNDIVTQIKDQIIITLNATRKKLLNINNGNNNNPFNNPNRKHCFELLGYDFMVDTMGQVYLIEVNSNPSLEESCPFLSTLLMRMINDMFRITIDKVFSPAKNINEALMFRNSSSTFRMSSIGLNEFALEGYTFYENLWEHIGSLASII